MLATRCSSRVLSSFAAKSLLKRACLSTYIRSAPYVVARPVQAANARWIGLGSLIATRQFRSSAAVFALPSHTVVGMPALSPTMSTGNVASWAKEEGEKVAAGDVIAEIETDKAVMDFESNDDGFIAKILVAAGAKDVPVGKPLYVFVEDKADVAAFKDFTVSGDAAPAATPSATQSAPATPSVTQLTAANVTEEAKASPLAKKMAKEMGIDISGVQGSGPNGRVIEADMMKAQAKPVTAAAPVVNVAPASPLPSYVDTELTNMRKIIASRLLESKTTIPHYYLTSEIHIDNLMALRAQLNTSKEYKLSVNDFIIKASALACKAVPDCNSSWMEAEGCIRQYEHVDVSVAVSTPAGLITPIVFAAENKGLVAISNSVKDLASRAKINKLKPQEYQGGTFTVSNLGMFGITSFSAIVNPPQSCILAVGGAVKKMMVEN
eukprot:Ihof_evm3s275 gene=Ihof_evmTU3s275